MIIDDKGTYFGGVEVSNNKKVFHGFGIRVLKKIGDCGFPTLLSKCPGTVIGKWNLGILVSGIVFDTDGDRYEGEFKDGNFNGKGIYYSNNGNRYEGEFKDGEYNGKGIAYYTDGDRYKGEYKDDKKNGKGNYYYNNGDRYDGEWKDNEKNGKGIFYFNGGGRYEGEFKNNARNGKGISYHHDGNRYEGEFKDDVGNGKGIFYYKNGNRYDGEWKDNYRNGKGIFYFKNGNRYEGEYKEGKKNGKGILYKSNGEMFEQLYEKGKLVSEVIFQKELYRLDSKIGFVSEKHSKEIAKSLFGVKISFWELQKEMKNLGVICESEFIAAKQWIENKLKKKVFHDKYGKIPVEYLIAVHLYTRNALFRTVNQSMRDLVGYKKFKVLIKCLVLAFEKLTPKFNLLKLKVFRGSRIDASKEKDVVEKGKLVSFSTITSTSKNETRAKAFIKNVFFEIDLHEHVQSSLYVKDFSEYPIEDEVLIPPFVVFMVMDVKKNVFVGSKKVDYCVTLKESKQHIIPV